MVSKSNYQLIDKAGLAIHLIIKENSTKMATIPQINEVTNFWKTLQFSELL